MPRRTLDLLLSSAGALLVVVLVLAGALLMWGYNFANGSVRSQLVAQKIFFPPSGSEALASPEVGPFLNKYAGQQLVNGDQAKAYADHFIAVHLKGVAGGETYAQVSARAQQNKNDTALATQATTLFRGETLRGLLLTAYAFWKIGQLALLGSIVSFVLAATMLVLSVLGFVQVRRAASAALPWRAREVGAA